MTLAMSQRRRAHAAELRAEAKSLPFGHPKKEKLLYHADMALHSADLHEERERYASGEFEDMPSSTEQTSAAKKSGE